MSKTSIINKAEYISQHIRIRSLSRFFGITFFSIVLAFVVAVASISRKQYTDFLLETVHSKLRQKKLYISLDEPKLIRKHYFSPLPLSLTAKQFTLSYISNDTQLTNTYFPLTDFEIQFQLRSILILRPTILITGKQDDGLLRLKITKSLLNGNFYISGSVDKFSISRYQILKEVGITQGNVTTKVDSLVVSNGLIKSGNGWVSLNNLHKSQITSVEALSKNLPKGIVIPFPLPPWDPINFKSNFEYESDTKSESNLSLLNLTLSAAEGLIKGEASIALPKWLYSFNTTVSLTPKGQSDFSSYLPLISGGKLTSKTINFNVQATNISFTKISLPLEIRFTLLPNQIPASQVTTIENKYSF
jgi:hypothetical protein